MFKFNLFTHGEVRNLKVKVGKDTFLKREKFCVIHGWEDLFMAGGEAGWNNKHAACSHPPATTKAPIRMAA